MEFENYGNQSAPFILITLKFSIIHQSKAKHASFLHADGGTEKRDDRYTIEAVPKSGCSMV
jgi:hypothetical protein